METIKGRLSEPSTWAGFAALLETLKMFFPAHAAVIVGVQAIMGGIAMVARETGGGAVSSDTAEGGSGDR